MKIAREPMKCFMHCSTLSTRVVRELEMPALFSCCISFRRSIISGADWKAVLSSSESFDIHSCITFCNASSLAGTSGVGDWSVIDCAPVTGEGVGVAPLDRPGLRSESNFALKGISFQYVNRKIPVTQLADKYLLSKYYVSTQFSVNVWKLCLDSLLYGGDVMWFVMR